MLDGATDEDPFSILSASIEHPLEVGGESEASSREIAQRKDKNGSKFDEMSLVAGDEPDNIRD